MGIPLPQLLGKEAKTPLPQLSGKLAELTGQPGLPYPVIWRAAAGGRLPVIRIGGRLFVRDADLDAAAEALGLTKRA